MAAEPVWVLEEELATKREGEPIRFARMVMIGPMSSNEPQEWATFSSEQEAMQSPAYLHALSCFEPKEVVLDGVA